VSQRRFRTGPAIAGEPVVKTQRARAEGRDLKQASCHHDVLEEADHLILIGEVAVERHGRCERKQGQRDYNRANAETRNDRPFRLYVQYCADVRRSNAGKRCLKKKGRSRKTRQALGYHHLPVQAA
jgi:hypothetical protein